jgi:hypothetical protein
VLKIKEDEMCLTCGIKEKVKQNFGHKNLIAVVHLEDPGIVKRIILK